MLTGLDVSRHQGVIDWPKVASAGHSFAFPKCTDGIVKNGRMWVDPYWQTNRDEARKAGLKVGGYHYARPSLNPPELEADHFFAHLGTTDLPPVLDIEDPDAEEGVGEWCARFLTRLESRAGKTPIIYTYPYYWNTRVGDDRRFARFPLWIARYREAPPDRLKPWDTWTFWQHTSSGSCPGIQGRVDLNRATHLPGETMRERFLAEARSEIGYVEQKTNKTKFATEAGHIDGYPWCGTFIVAMARRVGINLPSESAFTPSMANAFKATGAWHTVAQPGDLCFFDFPDSKNRIQHVGIVESSDNTTVTCIEGNTAKGTAGSQDNGGGVYRRTRPRTHVAGFGRPAFITNPTYTKDDLLMSAAKDDDDARRCLVRQWFWEYLGRGPKTAEEQALHVWVAGTKGVDACLAGIVDSAEARQYRAKQAA